MNKEEMQKVINVVLDPVCHECYFPKKRTCQTCLDSNKKVVKKYIQDLESKLDKITEECRKQVTEYEDSILEIFPQRILEIIEGEKE